MKLWRRYDQGVLCEDGSGGRYNQDTFYTYILYIYELYIHMKISKNK